MPLLQKGIQACGQLAELAEDYISAHMSLGSVGGSWMCIYISYTEGAAWILLLFACIVIFHHIRWYF